MKKRNGSGSRRLVEMTVQFQESQHDLLRTLEQKGLIGTSEQKRMGSAVDRAVAQKRSSDVLSTATLIHGRIMKALDESIEDMPEQREAREIEVLAKLATTVQTTTDERELFKKVMALVQTAVPYENGTLFLFDREEDRLDAMTTVGQRVDLIDGVQFDMGSGLSAWVAKKKKPILITELARPGRPGEAALRSFLSMPLVVQGTMIGVLNLGHSEPRKFDEDHLRFVGLAGSVVAGALERVLTEREVRRQAVCDRLTGLYNRRHFLERLSGEIERARRHYQPFSLLSIDVDNLDQFNQRYGNPAGDRVLQEIAKVLARWSRSSDIVSRYGGEEFAILMPATSAEEASMAAERLRRSIETHTFPQKRRITVSLGAASFPEDADTDLDLIAKAEQALFMAKKDGRNRAVAFHALAVH